MKNKTYLKVKRLLDIILSVIGIVVLSPLLIIISICIKITSKGPVIFKQKRIGKDGKFFDIYKFIRTLLRKINTIYPKLF